MICVTSCSSMASSSCCGRLVDRAKRAGESLEEAALFGIQVRGKDHRHLGVEITTLLWLTQTGHALPA